MHINIYLCIYIYTCVHLHIYICICKYKHIFTHTHTCIYGWLQNPSHCQLVSSPVL